MLTALHSELSTTPSEQECARGPGPAAGPSLTWRGPPPRFHESIWGVWQKLCYLNALSQADAHHLFPHCDARDRLARLRALIPSHGPLWPDWSVGASQLTPCMAPWELTASFLRFCPECIVHGFHSAAFQLPHLECCPAHGHGLQDGCPACGLRLPYRLWQVRPAFQCDCGYVLWPGRHEVGQWYRPPSHLQRIDAFVRRLLLCCNERSRQWWRIDQCSESVDEASDLLQRVLCVSPMELHRLPRVFHGYLSERVLDPQLIHQRLSLPQVFESHSIAFTEWNRGLLDQVEHLAYVALGHHAGCMRELVAYALDHGTRLYPYRCVVANAFLLWRAHWQCIAVQLALVRIVEWGALLVRAGLSSQSAARSACPTRWADDRHWEVQCGALSDLIAQQVLVTNLARFGEFARHVLGQYHLNDDSAIPFGVSRVNRTLLNPMLPSMWVELHEDPCECAHIWHQGLAPLEVLDRTACACRSSEGDCGFEAEVLESRGDMRSALDQGLTFAQLLLGQCDPR